MIIQSKRIWVVNTWLAAQVEVEEGKIVNIYPYGEKDVPLLYVRFLDCCLLRIGSGWRNTVCYHFGIHLR